MKTLPALLVLAALVLVTPDTAYAAKVPRCDGHRATIVGTDGHDELSGTGGRDVIVGPGGDDWIHGSDDDDVICGGDGSDLLYGGRGDDRLFGGHDRIWTAHGKPRREGDHLFGGYGDDVYSTGTDARVPDGLARDLPDSVEYQLAQGPVHLDLREGTAAGMGSDRIKVVAGTRYTLTPYDDTVVGSDLAEHVLVHGGHDRVNTGAGDDHVVTQDGTGQVSTGDGDDVVEVPLCEETGTLDLGPGDDHLTRTIGESASWPCYGVVGAEAWAGDGVDSLWLAVESGHDTTWDLGTGLLSWRDHPLARLGAFEDVRLTSWGLVTITGTDAAESVRVGLPDHDGFLPAVRFTGNGGDDVLGGDVYADRFDGGPGTDTYESDLGGGNACRDVEADPTGACQIPMP